MDAGQHDHRRDHDLTEELPPRTELEKVVDETHRHSENRGDRSQREPRGANLFGNEEGVTREPVDEPEDENGRSESDRDRKTSGARDRARVDAAAARHVEHSEPSRDDADQRRRDRREREGEQRGTRKEDGGGRHRGHDNENYA